MRARRERTSEVSGEFDEFGTQSDDVLVILSHNVFKLGLTYTQMWTSTFFDWHVILETCQEPCLSGKLPMFSLFCGSYGVI